MHVLAGDIGGTHSRLCLAEVGTGTVRCLHTERYLNTGVEGLEVHLSRFLAGRTRPQAACLAVAGPTDGEQSQLTNLAWNLSATRIAQATGIARVRLINDFQAVGQGIDTLAAQELAWLQPHTPQPRAPRAVLGAGTGLGVSLGVWDGQQYHHLPGEGGHIGFAPADPEQDALLAHLRQRHGRVSVERLLSGPGIVDLYRFCTQDGGAPPEAAAITQAALTGSDAQATRAMRLFCRIYGQTAGDLALISGARGGVYVAGGIAAKILPLLMDGEFLAGFRDKGRFANWMRDIPVAVVLDPDVGLKGAALMASYPVV